MKKNVRSPICFFNRRIPVRSVFFPAGLLLTLLALSFYPTTFGLPQARPPATYSPEKEDPGAPARWERLRLQDEHGRIPPNALINAYAQKKAMPFRPEAWGEFLRGGATTEGIQPGTAGIVWSTIGPGNIGGRTTSIVIHPSNPSIMWLGADTGGIWKTSDGGGSWAPLDDFLANLAISCLAIDPTNPNVLYAGTQSPTYFGNDASIFKTTDGGTTWTQLTSSVSYVNRIAISPTNNQIMLVATSFGGIYRSTNAGQTFSQVFNGTGIAQVVFHPTDGTQAVAATHSSVLYSTDGGQTWVAATGLPSPPWAGRAELAYASSDPSIVYASVYVVDGGPLQIYRSTDGGDSFVGPVGSLSSSDSGILWVDPTNANTLVAGGINLSRSTDAGVTFIDIGTGDGFSPGTIHVDQHVFVSHPNFNGSTNKTVFVGNDGGIFKTDDIYSALPDNNSWVKLVHHLAITQFYGGAGNPTSGRVIGGNQDNGTVLSNQGTEDWVFTIGGDGAFCAADQTDENTFYGEAEYRYLIRISWDNGAAHEYRIDGGIDDSPYFFAPFILDPNNQTTLLWGGRQLWRTLDAKASPPSWSSIKAALPGPTPPFISAIAVAQGNSDIVWVGHNDGEVYYTTNGTAANPTWIQANLGSPNLPARYCNRITIDPHNSNVVYVTFGGFDPDNVWRTTDYGATWTNISNGLPSAPVYSLVVSPSNSSALYVGMEVGVFASADGGATWSPSNDGPANVGVDELFWVGTNLVAATHGRGMFVAGQSVAGHPAFFSGEISLGNGIYYLQFPNGNLFGYYSYLTDPHFIYHFDMGYEYWFDANDGQGGIFFYDFASGHFFYTSPSFAFPYLYDFTLNTVLYYYPDPNNPGHYTSNPRYFYDFATGQIITL